VKLGAGDLEEKARLELLINPGVKIPEQASAVHGITDEKVANCPRFKDVARDIGEFISGCDLAGHNAISYDIVLLRAEMARCGFRIALVPDRRLIDTLELFRLDIPHTLAGALAFYCDREIGDDAHDAMVDVEACVDVLRAQAHRRDYDLLAMAEDSYGDRVTLDGKLAKDADGDTVLTFGKYKGEKLAHLALTEPSFLRWMLDKDFADEVKDLVRAALQRKE
jgi:DNA polymerase-3 subunit epsilon